MRVKFFLFVLGCLLAQILLLCQPSICQSEPTVIQGTVKQLSGSPLSGARTLAVSLTTGKRYWALTDSSGHYVLNQLPEDNYKLRFEGAGFKPWSEEFIATISGMQPAEVDVSLADIESEQVSGSAGKEPSILKIDRTDVSTTFTQQEIEALPIYNQNLSRLELLVPGASPSIEALPPFENPQQSTYVNLNGQLFFGSGFTLDGAINRDPLESLVVVIPSIESVSGVKVTTQNFGAEFGEATAGFVGVQTLSGTNSWHGGVYGYRQSGFGQAAVPSFGKGSALQSVSNKFDDFGASVGGAPVRDRLFLFSDYRGIRNPSDGTVLLTVPAPIVHETCSGLGTGNCDLSAYEQAGAPFNPGYSGGLIPNSQLSPEMVYFLQNFMPLPNYGNGSLTNNYLASGVEHLNSDSFDLRVDYVPSSRLRTFARYTTGRFRQDGSPAFGHDVGGPGTNPDLFAGRGRTTDNGVSADLSYTVAASLLADFRFGFFRYNQGLNSLDGGTMPATAAGISGLNLGTSFTAGMPDIQLDNPVAAGLPIAGNLDFTRIGFSPAANDCDCPLTEREQEFQWQTNWTRTSGSHVLKWGADIRYLQNFRLDASSRPAGHLEFGNGNFLTTGFSLGDFLIGALSSFSRSYNNPDNSAALNAGERQKRWFFYGEDNWKVNSRLTVNYGLRWELYLPQSVTSASAGGWLVLGSGATPFQDQFVVAGEGGANRQGGVKAAFNNFGPRVGFAYLVNPRTVIRAGYGRVFDPGYGGTIFGIAATQSPPVGVLASVPAGFLINSQYSGPVDKMNNPILTDACEIAPNGCAAKVGNMQFGVPPFNFPTTSSFTVQDVYCANATISAVTSGYCPSATAQVQQQANFYALPRRLRLPTIDAWNLAVQEQLDRHTYFELSYVANNGTHVLNDSTGGGNGPLVPYYDLNEPTLAGYIAPNNQIGPMPPPVSNCQNPKAVGQNPYCKSKDGLRQAFVPLSTSIRYYGNSASSNYNSLQVKLRRQFSSGFSVLANYTWSKVLDFDNLFFAINPRVSRGVGNYDRTHNFVMTDIWDLPIGKGRMLLGDAGPVMNRLAGGWSLAAVTYATSGLPFTPTYSGCTADIGVSSSEPCRPNLAGPVHITGSRNHWFTTTGGQRLQASCVVGGAVEPCPSGTPTALQGFDPTSGQSIPGETIGPWQRPGAGQIGNAGRNSLRGPSFFQSDLALAKEIPITERVTVQFRTDAFNVFNKGNLGNPNPRVDSPTGGEITSLALGAIQRQLQFSLHVKF